MPEKYSICLESDNEKLNNAYLEYLEAKRKLEKCLYEEGITVQIKSAVSGN